MWHIHHSMTTDAVYTIWSNTNQDVISYVANNELQANTVKFIVVLHKSSLTTPSPPPPVIIYRCSNEPIEDDKSDWWEQHSALAKTPWLQHRQNLCKGCGLWDYVYSWTIVTWWCQCIVHCNLDVGEEVQEECDRGWGVIKLGWP